MDLFEMYRMTEFTEFPNLPSELQGIEIEPDYLPPINVESNRIYLYVCINYGPGEAKLLNEMVGYSFLRRKKNTFYYKEIVEHQNEQPTVYENDKDDYILVVFEPKELEGVMKMFNLPFYYKNDSFKLKDLVNHATLQLQ